MICSWLCVFRGKAWRHGKWWTSICGTNTMQFNTACRASRGCVLITECSIYVFQWATAALFKQVPLQTAAINSTIPVPVIQKEPVAGGNSDKSEFPREQLSQYTKLHRLPNRFENATTVPRKKTRVTTSAFIKLISIKDLFQEVWNGMYLMTDCR